MLKPLLALIIAVGCSQALAQKKMYRCGNQYQERPCAGPQAAPAAASGADGQAQQEKEQRRREREQSIHDAKCANYADELADIERRINAGADKEVIDQFRRREKEMRTRIARNCK